MALPICLLLTPGVLPAPERSAQLRSAEVVVIGKLELSSYFLFFDGIHINGSITPTEVLYGPTLPRAKLRFSHVIPCSVLDWIRRGQPIHCDYRAVWRQWTPVKELIQQNGVLVLWSTPEGSWTWRGWEFGLYPLRDLEWVRGILSDRKQRETGR